MGTILIVAETSNGTLRGASLNAVSLAAKLSEASGGGEIIGLVIGADTNAAAAQLAKSTRGTASLTKVLTAEGAHLGQYTAESYAPIVARCAKMLGADYVCATASAMGKDLLPRAAALLDTAMVSDVSDVIGPKTFKRPMMAGNAIGTVEALTSTVVVSGRQAEWPAATVGDASAPIEAVEDTTTDGLGAEVLKVDEAKSDRPELTEASIVVSGGRGMQSGENFKHLEKLADILGAAMGATRAACDAGMVPNDLQVGQTGKVVAPDLYLAVGISGAIQHLAGMKGSKVIVAINKDPEAAIFSVADFGMVAKWEDTLPELTEKLAALK